MKILHILKKVITITAKIILVVIVIGLLYHYKTTNVATKKSDYHYSARLKTYAAISTKLALLSDQTLIQLLEKAEQVQKVHSGVGGTALSVEINGTPVFVKKINLTDLEKKPENMWLTKNMFDLPLFYQYGVGSAGFGAWRELAVSIMTTNWVLSGECQNFPLMYHWRILPRVLPAPLTSEELKDFERDVEYWDGSPAIRARLEAIRNAPATIVLFLEHIPYVLKKWLEDKFVQGNSAAKSAVEMVESNLKTVTSFMNSHGLLHFDAHFGNILTDGHQLYVADFGLALSSQFELSAAESNFFNTHRNYDRYFTETNLVTAITGIIFERDMREAILKEFAQGKGNKVMAPWIESILMRYAPVADVWHHFFNALSQKSKSTPYPLGELERADKIKR